MRGIPCASPAREGFYYVLDRDTKEMYADVLKNEFGNGGVVTKHYTVIQQFFDDDEDMIRYCNAYFDGCIYLKVD